MNLSIVISYSFSRAGGGVTSFSVSLTRQALLDLNCFTLPLPIRCGGLSVTPIDSLVASIARLSPQIVFLSAGASDWLGARVLSAGAARAVIACSASVLSPALAASIAQTLYTHLGELCSGKSTDKLSIDALVECAAAAVTAADVPGIVFMSSPSPLPSPVSVPTPIASPSPVQILVTQDIVDDDTILCKRLCFGVLVPSSNPTAPAKVITSQSRLIPSTQSLLAIPLGSGTVYTLSMEGTSESIATFAVSVKWSSATSWSRSSPTMLLTRNDVSSPASTSNIFRSLSATVPTLILPSGACQTIRLFPTLEVTAALPAEYTGLPVFARNEVMGLLYPILPLSPAPLESDSSPGQQLLLGSCDRIHTLTFQPSVQPALQLFKVLPLPTDKTIADSGTAKVTVVDPSVAETLELEAPPVSGKGRSLLITLGVVAAVACVLNSGTRASLLAQLKSLRALRK